MKQSLSFLERIYGYIKNIAAFSEYFRVIGREEIS